MGFAMLKPRGQVFDWCASARSRAPPPPGAAAQFSGIVGAAAARPAP